MERAHSSIKTGNPMRGRGLAVSAGLNVWAVVKGRICDQESDFYV